MKTKQTFNPEAEATLTYVPSFQSTPFTITGLGETLQTIAADIESSQPKPTVSHVEAAQTVPAPKPEYTDLSTLAPRETLRRKISAWTFDAVHGTNMLGLLTERINDDRNVRFARDIGILGVTHCAKHEKAVNKLRGML